MGVDIGIIPNKGAVVSPVKYKAKRIYPLRTFEPELAIARLLHSGEKDLAVIEVQYKTKKWKNLDHQVLDRSLSAYGDLHYTLKQLLEIEFVNSLH